MRYEQLLAISSRHRSLLQLIREADNSCYDLAGQLGVSEPTVNRDIEYLRRHGYEIKAVRVDRRWAFRLIEAMVREDIPNDYRGDQG